MERMREGLEHLRKLVSDGSEREVELARRGVIDELELEVAWVEAHAVLLARQAIRGVIASGWS
jgi:hypothetical protein